MSGFHVAARFVSFVVLLHQHSLDEANVGIPAREDADNVDPAAQFPIVAW
jgi:hypothetical protein